MESTRRGFLGFFISAAAAVVAAPTAIVEAIAKPTGPVVAASKAGSTLTVSGLAQNLSYGDVFTIEGVMSVNPMTLAPTLAKQFVVTRSISASATSVEIDIFPAIIPDGPYQNVSDMPKQGAALIDWRIGMASRITFSKTLPAALFYQPARRKFVV